ncbi:MAG: SpoIID/LytB domain-containing protein [Tannerellaceae bacterium]|jgi:SpoIID/LytB domain protein|nr:SpoIID/LytB domain-containing protein [Tannerellaceae bacterium]
MSSFKASTSPAALVKVGVAEEEAVRFVFNSEYEATASGTKYSGPYEAAADAGAILFEGRRYDSIAFRPLSAEASFDLRDVVIGKSFHWERREDQRFRGELHLVADGNRIAAINLIDLEDYLESVISSEMNAAAPTEFLRAHAVISRSWLLAQIAGNKPYAGPSSLITDGELTRWYDREEHSLYDVCADDHCQRYQGITRASANSRAIADIVRSTRGEVLMHNRQVCDARFYKCCGGITERFESVWEPVPHQYLQAVADARLDGPLPDLSDEAAASAWIRSSPPAWCNTSDADLLSRALNNYDSETTPGFYRWTVDYDAGELSDIVRRRSGIDFGRILDLVPLSRGASGRIERLQIVGTKLTYIIGKELEIRRSLSESHLFSSAFVVDKTTGPDGLPQRFGLTGAGWGHGVGLCQTGAAVMGERGLSYRQILAHYYPGATIESLPATGN